MKKLATLFITLSLVACAATRHASIQSQLKKGDKMTYHQSTFSAMKLDLEGEVDEVTNSLTMDFLFEVKDVAKNNLQHIECTNLAISVHEESEMDGTLVDFDSKNRGDLAANDMDVWTYGNLVNAKTQMYFNNIGQLQKIDYDKGLLSKIIEGIEAEDEMEKRLQVESVKEFFNEKNTRQNLKMITGFYPEKLPKVGKSWTNITKSSDMLSLIYENTYTLIERNKQKAVIQVKATIYTDPNSKGKDYGIMSMKYDLSGTMSGMIELDELTGWAITSNYKENLRGDVVFSSDFIEDDLDGKVDLEYISSFNRE